MRCRIGDLAIVIRGPKQNLGREVTVVRLCEHVVYSGGVFVHHGGAPFWELDRTLSYPASDGTAVEVPYSTDEALMPIRPDGTESDETPDRIDREVTA